MTNEQKLPEKMPKTAQTSSESDNIQRNSPIHRPIFTSNTSSDSAHHNGINDPSHIPENSIGENHYSPYNYRSIPSGPEGVSSSSEDESQSDTDSNFGKYHSYDPEEESVPEPENTVINQALSGPPAISNLYSKALELPPMPSDSINLPKFIDFEDFPSDYQIK